MSAIAAMIDRACGVMPGMRAEWQQRPRIVLACTKCDAEKVTHREPIDPANAAFIAFPCSACGQTGCLAPRYFDALGAEIAFP